MGALCQMESKKLEVIAIELSKDTHQCSDVGWVGKVETRVLNKLCCCCIIQI